MISLKYSHLLSDPSPVSIQGNKSTKEYPFLCALEGNNDAQKLTSNMLPAPPWVREDTQASMQDTSRLTVELKRKETGNNWVIDSKWAWTIIEPHLPEKRRAWMSSTAAGCFSVNTSPHQLCWGLWEMWTATSYTKCSQMARLIHTTGRNLGLPF